MYHIVCSTDNKYFMQAIVMIKSVCENNLHLPLLFHVIIDKSVGYKQKVAMEEFLHQYKNKDVEFLSGDNALSVYPKIGEGVMNPYVSKASYYRLAIPKMLDAEVSKLLYLDCDLIVMGDIEPLFNISIENYALAAVPEMNEAGQDYQRLNFDANKGYFNAGVLLINLDYWRNHSSYDKFVDVVENQSQRIKAHDQDVLNMVFHNAWMRLHPKYNLLSGHLYRNQDEEDQKRYGEKIAEAVRKPIIVHFTGPFKPWFKEGQLHPYSGEFVKYLRQTEWKDYNTDKWCPLGWKHWLAMLLRSLRVKKELPNPYITLNR